MGLVVQKCWVPPLGTTSERNLDSLFIMNSAGADSAEEDEEQVCDGTGTRDWPLPGPIQELAPDP